MELDFGQSFFNRLRQDAAVGALVSLWGERNWQSIFTATPVPGVVGGAWILTEAESDRGNFTTDALAGDTNSRDVFCFAEASGSAALVDLLSREVGRLFTWSGLTEEGFEDWLSTASPAVIANGKKTFGRQIRVQLFKSTVSSGTIGFEDYEIPVETPNGSVTSFSTTREYLNGSLMVMVNGYPQRPGTDFTQHTDRQGYSFNTGAPATGTDLWHAYRYSFG
ncbi:hypothetical protein LCGC14_0893960 [marine sediment metagenome]|uniref:Uncharacterized protein n=1 Tax=marine sediment metagenome TaxID=412755 RepID=A0A0F9P376_9ZZZZ